MKMQRRRLLRSGALLAAVPATAGLAGCQGSLPAPFADWASARAAVVALRDSAPALANPRWNLAQMLQHAAQSIEFSLQGFPEPKPAWFQATLGSAAFALFDARGAMNHSLDEPIPGAPALDAALALPAAVQRLLDAMDAFDAHSGPLRSHFAYGELTREQFRRAHLMHLANHWQQLPTPQRG